MHSNNSNIDNKTIQKSWFTHKKFSTTSTQFHVAVRTKKKMAESARRKLPAKFLLHHKLNKECFVLMIFRKQIFTFSKDVIISNPATLSSSGIYYNFWMLQIQKQALIATAVLINVKNSNSPHKNCGYCEKYMP